jgi:hypothetical protein
MGGAFYRNVTRFSKLVTYNVAKAVFGFNERCALDFPEAIIIVLLRVVLH